MSSPASAVDLVGMRLALTQARQGRSVGEVPIGAVIIRDGAVLASAHNETIARHDPTAHAEFVALQRALAVTADNRLVDSTLYVTLEPCALCAGAIVLAKIRRVVFSAWDDRAGMAGSIHDILRNPRLNHQVDVLGGILAEEGSALLRDFFTERR